MLQVESTGRIVILNGAPRSGKSSIARVIQETFDGVWMNLGVDGFMRMYHALYASIAAHSRAGLNVVVDVGHHDVYSVPRGILPVCARQLAGLPVLVVGVCCPLEVIMERRRATWPCNYPEDGSIPEPVQRWQVAVHLPGIYDLEVDTSRLSAEECAELIRQRLESGPPGTACHRLAAMS